MVKPELTAGILERDVEHLVHCQGCFFEGFELHQLWPDGFQGVVQHKLDVHRQRVLAVNIQLEERQEVVELLLLGPSVEAHPARVKQDANKADAEEVVGHVDGARLPR